MSTRLVRPAAVAGTFYPAEPVTLRNWVTGALRRADQRQPKSASRPRAIVVPHAGYVYSGDVAATAYATLGRAGAPIQCVVLFGPAHTIPVATVAASSAEAFATPLGLAPTDTMTRDALVGSGRVAINDAAHAGEHSLEVQVPFLQVALGDVMILPLLVGLVAPAAVIEVLEHVWDDVARLIVVSTDLSHYHDYPTATRLDRTTADAVVRRRPEILGPRSACGLSALQGLVTFAAAHDVPVQLLDLRNSGDTAGPRDRVVGYGAFALI